MKCSRFNNPQVSKQGIMMNSTMAIFLVVYVFVACTGYVCSSDYGYGDHGISAAIISKHSIHSIPHGGDGGNGKTTHVNIHGGVAPVKMHFSSRSSPIYMSHSHYNSGGSYSHSSSYDKPHKRVHVVHKPVIHELKEIISPYKNTYQIIKPVMHSYKTSVFSGHGYGR